MLKEYLHAERIQPWREALRKTIKNKERTDPPRVKMPEQPRIRIHNFQEVNLDLHELALAESHRCLDCKILPASWMPVEVNIPSLSKTLSGVKCLKQPKH